MVDVVYKVELKAGNTMVIPAGWIHAVVSPFVVLGVNSALTVSVVHAGRHHGLWWKFLAFL
jgi:mannose-6-phosphate isomerase class I